MNWLRGSEESFEDGRYMLLQISNAYAVLPPSLWRAAGLLLAKAPLPAPGTWGDHLLPDVVGQAASRLPAGLVVRSCCGCWISDRRDRLAVALLKLGSAVSRVKP